MEKYFSLYRTHVCKLHKAIYGLKQAFQVWYHELQTVLLIVSLVNSQSNASLFMYYQSGHTMYLLVYVNNIILTGDDSFVLASFVATLFVQLSLIELGHSLLLRVQVLPHLQRTLFSQHRYIDQ